MQNLCDRVSNVLGVTEGVVELNRCQQGFAIK
jgi:hypothetical protein